MQLSKYKTKVMDSPVMRKIIINTLQEGPIPDHIAFIMDGNRRYSKLHEIPTAKGHYLGSVALEKV
jgi:ditrans,polycis-polyprenyl diphosphate synthase